MSSNTTIDDNGRQVLSFMGKAENLGRIGDLTKAVVEMAESGVWRDYRTGLGREQWRRAEFDYFLIAMGVRQPDARSVIKWNDKGAALAPLMDPSANGRDRRPLEAAAESWHAAGPEGFAARAKRLEWLASDGTVKPPVTEWAQRTLRAGMNPEHHAQQIRAERISPRRRQELDRLVEGVLEKMESADERRYALDQLRRSRSPAELRSTWQADAERLEWKATALAEHWDVSRQLAHRRIKELKADAK